MGKQPSFQFYPGDWMQDTRALSLAAKGAWIDILCALWRSSSRGTLDLPLIGWARLIGASVEHAKAAITELVNMQTCDCLNHPSSGLATLGLDDVITLRNRRMHKEAVEAEKNREYVQAYRQRKTERNLTCKENVRFCKDDVRSDVRCVKDAPKANNDNGLQDSSETCKIECKKNVSSYSSSSSSTSTSKQKENPFVADGSATEKNCQAHLPGIDPPPEDKNGKKSGNKTNCPTEKIADLYSEICSQKFKRCKELTDKRRKAMRLIWSSKPECQSLDWWRNYFQTAQKIPWLCGVGMNGWKANIDFLLRPDNVTRVFEEEFPGAGFKGDFDAEAARIFGKPSGGDP